MMSQGLADIFCKGPAACIQASRVPIRLSYYILTLQRTDTGGVKCLRVLFTGAD